MKEPCGRGLANRLGRELCGDSGGTSAEQKDIPLFGRTTWMSTILALAFPLIAGASLRAQDNPAKPPQSLQEKTARFYRHAEE